MRAAVTRVASGLILMGLVGSLCGCETSRDGVSVNVSKALQAYRESVNRKPDRAQMEAVIEQLPAEQLTDLGVMYERENRLDDAALAYHRAIARNIYYTRAYVNLGNVLREQGKPEEARARYRQALVIDSTSVEAANNFADLCASDGACTDEAIGRLEPLVGKAGALRPYALDTLGWLYHQKGQNDRAYQLLSEASAAAGPTRGPLLGTIHTHLAAVCRALGRDREAESHEAAARAAGGG